MTAITQSVDLDRRGRIAVLTVNNPPVNALSQHVRQGLYDGVTRATADPWPLNPRGELLLGLKIENVRALASVEASTRVPGIAFAEWGPGDMGMSMGYPDQHDEPYPADMDAARARVLGACKAAGLAFLEQVTPANVLARIAEGVRIGTGRQGPEAAALSRRHTGRTMPW